MARPAVFQCKVGMSEAKHFSFSTIAGSDAIHYPVDE